MIQTKGAEVVVVRLARLPVRRSESTQVRVRERPPPSVNQAVPQAQIVATDVNPAVLEFATQRIRSEPVPFERADAQALPFGDGSFDPVLCQSGVMFFPDKVRANPEARRVLGAGGHYLLVSFDRLELNSVPTRNPGLRLRRSRSSPTGSTRSEGFPGTVDEGSGPWRMVGRRGPAMLPSPR